MGISRVIDSRRRRFSALVRTATKITKVGRSLIMLINPASNRLIIYLNQAPRLINVKERERENKT